MEDACIWKVEIIEVERDKKDVYLEEAGFGLVFKGEIGIVFGEGYFYRGM